MDRVRAALEAVTDLDEADDLELPQCGAAIAAAEVVAALIGNAGEELPEDAADWAEEHREAYVPELGEIALGALARIKTNSEMLESWEDDAGRQEWLKAVEDLERRLATEAE
jgi:hypothetical protein